MNKWTKCFVVQVFEDDKWKTMTRPMTEMQAIRLSLTERILRRFYDMNALRIININN